MSDENNNSSSNNKDSLRTYSFMNNILSESKHRTQYIKLFEKMLPDARVPLVRIVAALAASIALSLFVAWSFFSEPLKLQYTAVQLLVMEASGLMLIFLFLIPAGSKSMLNASVDMTISSFAEKIRRAGKEVTDLKTFGIDSVVDGVCKMTNGDYGLMFEVEGHLSNSTLPAIADAVASARQRYLLARNATSYTTMLMSIKHTDLTKQLDNLQSLTKIKTDSTNADADSWRHYMAKLNHEQVAKRIKSVDMSIYQVVVLCDTSIENLIKSREAFVSAAQGGMYASCYELTDEAAMIDKLSSVTSLSKKGAMNNVKGQTEKTIYETKQK